MSAGHRPTWAPSRGQQTVSHLSQQTHSTGLTSHTKLKFRQPPATASSSTSTQPGHMDERTRRDLKRELEQAELEAKNKRRALQGLSPVQLDSPSTVNDAESETETSRKEALRKAIELDRDDDEDDDNDDDDDANDDAGDARAAKSTSPIAPGNKDDQSGSGSDTDSEQDDDDDDDEDEEEDEEDETAALLLELEKIKAERAAARKLAEQEQSANTQATREEEIAYGNPLLNLEHILHPTAKGTGRTADTNQAINFGVKRRWDDDVIFKNQASPATNASTNPNSTGFVNDLTRSDFHKKFMNRYIR